MQYKIAQTLTFKQWLKELKDPLARISVLKRIERAENGNFGDWKALGDGINEMRLNIRKGYRIYYAQQGKVIYILLNGGDKSSQQADIEKAKEIWADLKNNIAD